MHAPDPIDRSGIAEEVRINDGIDADTDKNLVPDANEMIEEFHAYWHRAQEALAMKCAYNRGRLVTEFQTGDKVLINPHNLGLLRQERGRGKKLLMKYDGPFEILRKLSPVTYQLRMPESYGMHPILNIAHLEKYNISPSEFGERETKHLNRADFEQLQEFEVEKIVSERRKRTRNGRHIRQYLTRFKGYTDDWDEWLNAGQLRNAPEVLIDWEHSKSSRR